MSFFGEHHALGMKTIEFILLSLLSVEVLTPGCLQSLHTEIMALTKGATKLIYNEQDPPSPTVQLIKIVKTTSGVSTHYKYVTCQI